MPLGAVARFCVLHRRGVVAAWVAALAGFLALGGIAGGTFEDEFGLPGSESQRASELLAERGFEERAGRVGQIVVHAPGGITDPEVEAHVGSFLEHVEAEVTGVEITGSFRGPGSDQRISPSGSVAYADIALADRSGSEFTAAAERIERLREEFAHHSVDIELGGEVFAGEPSGGNETLGLLAATVILLIAFGSLIAAGLPIVTALLGIGLATALVMLAARVLTMPSFTLQLVLMLGIGVGIDYALFVVSRYRDALQAAPTPADAVEQAMATSGRAVFFAGATFAASVMGMFVVGLDVNRSLAIASALGVLATMLAALTVLPAILGFVGSSIDRLTLPGLRPRTGQAATSFWSGWSRQVQRRPLVLGTAAIAVLILLSAPVMSMRLGLADAGNRPQEDTTRRAYDLLAEGFGPGFNGPLILVADLATADHAEVFERTLNDLAGVEGIARVTPMTRNPAGDLGVAQVIPTSAPQDEATTTLVHDLRRDLIPAATQDTGLTVHVAGAQAAVVDFSDFIRDRLPIFIAAVLVASFLILTVVFRSIPVALKAIVMNLLSIGAAYGLLVVVFQWGWGAERLGVGEPGPIEAWAPLMLFAVVFGLSMDYEVFLLSRIREEYERTGDTTEAVATGLASTARVITAAAAIMVVVFAGFVLADERALQLFGFGLAAAIFVDASLVRLVLLPAAMEILGDRNWWLPSWMHRLLPSPTSWEHQPTVHLDHASLAGTTSAGES